ncbi:hypothetical protein GGR28_002330 [Lewinella aquimaris]|uniref:Uncharacterized protein n=1 Tax=Neolewinella aquimaris TaxID=1835722 RepID=A0A840E7W4_9BACT|nr:hypothetical protein [Neolewinella aquimaris]MBB4079705.1 hypothetical protein [Neolewinella aquimaris]
MAIVIDNNALSTIPFFSENQVLRARDLNNLVKAVFDQLRQNRIFNIGLGIVEGFSVSWDEVAGAIVVSRGYGVSSDGYSFDLGECTFTHYRRAAGLADGYNRLASDCDEYDDLLQRIANGGYELGQPTATDVQLEGWQPLFLREGENPNDEPIASGNYCLLYLYREAQIARASCFSECEAKGAEQVGNYHAILVPAQPKDDNGPSGDSFEVQLPDVPRLPAFGLVEERIKLCRILSWQDLYRSYHTACVAVRAELTLAYGSASLLLDPPAVADGDPDPTADDTALFKRLAETLSGLTDKLFPPDPGASCTDIQYLYGYYRELIQAYAAIYHLLQGQTINLGNSSESANLVIRCAFSGHLGLRGLYFGDAGSTPIISDKAEVADPCRSNRILPDNGEERRNLLSEARSLLARMQTLATAGNLLLSTWEREGLTDLRLTPDARRFPFLQGRALPFYYQPSVMNGWRVGEQPNVQVYQYVKLDADHPLLFAEEDWDFYQIEGHLAKPLELTTFEDDTGQAVDTGVQARLKELRDCLNLAFDITAVCLDEIGEEESAPSIEGTDWGNWYKNTRNDLIGALKPIVPRDKNKADDVDPVVLKACREVMTFLEGIKDLSDISGWRGLQPVDFCSPVPDTLVSDRLDDFVTSYSALIKAIEQARQEQQKGDDVGEDELPYLDPRLAECIRQAAVAERLFRETIWREGKLAGFALSHPGLVHLGGVPKGGTFVLVYKTTFDREGLIRELRRFITGTDINIGQLSDEELLKFARRFQFNVSLFNRKEVVADFCLPYLCCGTGPVYVNTVPIPPPPPLELLAADRNCYVERDNEPEPLVTVTVNETGGELTFTVDGNVVGSTHSVSALTAEYPLSGLTDADLASGALVVTAHYRKDDRSAEDLFRLTLQPIIRQAAINFLRVEPDAAGNNRCIFELVAVISPTFQQREIRFGQNVANVAEDNTFRLPETTAQELSVVTLVVRLGKCEATIELPLPRKPIEPVDPNVVITPPQDFATVLNTRRTQRMESLEDQLSDAEPLENDEAYKRTLLYVSDTGENVKPDKGLEPALTALKDLTTAEPERKTFVHRIGRILAVSFLDKLALIGKKEELTEANQKSLDLLKKELDALGISRNTVFSDWGVSELYDGVDRTRLTNIGKQLRDE